MADWIEALKVGDRVGISSVYNGERWHGIVAALSDKSRNLPAARNALRELLGDRIIVRNENGDLFAEIAASSDTQIIMVAGAGSVLYLSEPIRIPLRRAS